MTGFTSMADVLAGKRLELLKEAIPKLSRVAVVQFTGSDESQWKESQRAARQLGLQLHSMELGSPEKYESAFKEAIKAGSTALAVTRHRRSQVNANQKRIIALAAEYRLPAIYFREDFVEGGVPDGDGNELFTGEGVVFVDETEKALVFNRFKDFF